MTFNIIKYVRRWWKCTIKSYYIYPISMLYMISESYNTKIGISTNVYIVKICDMINIIYKKNSVFIKKYKKCNFESFDS